MTADPLGDWLGTCGDCGLPMWSTQRVIQSGTGFEHMKCDRPSDPGVVSPALVSPPTTTTEGTTMADECRDCDHPRDRHKGPICVMRDCDCTGYACPHDTAADCDCPRGCSCSVNDPNHLCDYCAGTASDPAFDPGGALAGPPDTAWFVDTAKGIIGGGGQRRQDYGSVEESFENIARLWSVVLGIDVTAEQVALCQALLKMGRLLNKPNHTDSWVDIIGYAALGGQIAHQPGRHT